MNRSMVISGVALALTLSTSLEARGAPDEPRLRYTSLFEEDVDGARAPRAMVETAMLSTMIARGATFIDESQSRKVRAVTSARALLSGPIPEVITTLDADVIIAGVVHATRGQTSTLLRDKAERYQVSIDARLIAVDTGQVLDSILLEESGFGTSRVEATDVARRRAGEALANRVLGSQTSRPAGRRIELEIEALPDVSATSRLRGALLTLPGVRSAEVAHASTDVTELEVVLGEDAAPIEELAQSIQRTPELGIVVTGYAPRSIKARYSAVRAPRMPILLGRFSGKSPATGDQLAAVVGRALVDQSPVEPAANGAPIILGDTPRAQAKSLEAHGLLGEEALFLTGRYTTRGPVLDVEAEIRSTLEGFALVVSDASTCARDALFPCARDLAKRLATRLPEMLSERQIGARALEPHPLALREIEAKDVFPARRHAYEKSGLGIVRVENRASVSASKGLVKIEIQGLTHGAIERDLPDLAPKSARDLPLPILFDEARLGILEDDHTLPLEVIVSYEFEGRRVVETRTQSVQVLDKNAVDWNEPTSIAAFVTPKAEMIRSLSEAAIAALPDARSEDVMARPVALFRALGTLRYQRDAVHPGRSDELDHVQFPVETLARGRGDCDDLAVLYAALAEAAGLRTALILTPGHVLVAIDAELPAQSAQMIALDPTRVLTRSGRSWIPVETTLIGATFAEAWAQGAHVIAEARRSKEPQWIEVRDAWTRFAPETFVAEHGATPKPSFAGVKDELSTIFEARARDLERALASADAALSQAGRTRQALNDKAVLLVAASRVEEARATLEEALSLGPTDELLNNLGNVWLILGNARRAEQSYVDALSRRDLDRATQIRVHLNAAVAARVRLAHARFSGHIADALDLATDQGSRRLVTDFLESLGGTGAVVGARSDGLDRRAFAVELARALETRGMLDRRAPSSIRAEAQGRAPRVDVGQIVFWLSSPSRGAP